MKNEVELLKPCPFCGNRSVYISVYPAYFVNCTTCKGCGPLKSVKKRAVELWNTRAMPELVELDEERLERFIESFVSRNNEDFNSQNLLKIVKENHKNLIKAICQKFGQRPVPSVEDLYNVILDVQEQLEATGRSINLLQSDRRLIAEAIHAMLKGEK